MTDPHEKAEAPMGPSERVAKEIYAAMVWAAERSEFPFKALTWTENGNSHAQVEARRAADAAIAAMPAPDASAIRNAALMEAARVCLEYSKDHGAGMFDVHSAECERRIIALAGEPRT